MNTTAKRQALTHYTEQARIAMLEQQRDELAKALRTALDDIKAELDSVGDDYKDHPILVRKYENCNQARAVLSRIKS